ELGLHSAGPGTATSAPPGPGPGPSAPPPPQGAAPVTVTYAAPAYPPGPTLTAPLVSNGKRFGAYVLDAVLLIVTLIIGWFIWMFIILGKGQTPGKALLGIRVVDANTGRVPSYGTMALRVLV